MGAGGGGIIIIILPNLCLNDVPILKSDSEACNYLRHEGSAHFHGLKENRAPASFHHPESSLDDVPGTGVLAVKERLYRVLHRLPVWGDEADVCTQARVATIPEDTLACRWIKATSIDRAVPQHPDIMHGPRISHKYVNKFPTVVSDGL